MADYSFINEQRECDMLSLDRMFALQGVGQRRSGHERRFDHARTGREGYPVCSFGPGVCPTLGRRPLNPYRWALDSCESWCGPTICKEYGNKVAKYFDCLRDAKYPSQCERPIHPRNNNCRLC